MRTQHLKTPIRMSGLVTGALLLAVTACGTPVAGSVAPAPVASQSASSGSSASQPGPSASTSPSTVRAGSSGTPTATSPLPPARTSRTPRAVPPKKAEPAVLLQKGDTGDRVRELQHRLFQLDWFPGPITGSYRAATVEAVSGFQQRRDIEVSGAVDQKTWNALVKRTQQPTRDQLYNILRPGPAILSRGSQGDQVRELQSRLKQIGWHTGKITDFYGAATVSNVRGFQARRAIPVTGEVDQRTWDRLTAMTREPTRNEKHNVLPRPSVAGLDSRCMTGRAMCVSKSTNQLVWVIDGQPQLRVDVRFGSQELPTREGAFSVGWKSRDHVSTLYHTPMPFAMFFSGGQAVHYSPDFAARGYAGASHGCVNVRDRQAIEHLFDTVRVGDKVIVHR